MVTHPETPHAPVADVVAGHFHSRAGYGAYRSRGTNDWLLIHTLSGSGQFGFTGGRVLTEPGDIVLLRPGTPHDYGVHGPRPNWQLLWTHFHPRSQWNDLLNWPDATYQTGAATDEPTGIMRLRFTEPHAARLGDWLEQVNRLANGPHRNRKLLAMNALEEVLLWCDEWNSSRSNMIDPRIQGVIEKMCQTLNRPMPISELADLAGLSPSRFNSLFRQLMGTSPQQYHEQRRLDHAARLLEMTSMPIKTISRELGFNNQYYFSRRFSLHTSLCPRDYRNRALQSRKAFE